MWYSLTRPAYDTVRVSFILQHAVDHAKDDITENGGVSVTDVTWVVVITWIGMVPRMYYSSWYDSVSGNTFECF